MNSSTATLYREEVLQRARSSSTASRIGRPDLDDRAIFLTLSPIAEANRRSEAKLWCEFNIERPRILGALLDAVSYGLRAIGRVQLVALPRMAELCMGLILGFLRAEVLQ